jgi:hypothetical protein
MLHETWISGGNHDGPIVTWWEKMTYVEMWIVGIINDQQPVRFRREKISNLFDIMSWKR